MIKREESSQQGHPHGYHRWGSRLNVFVKADVNVLGLVFFHFSSPVLENFFETIRGMRPWLKP